MLKLFIYPAVFLASCFALSGQEKDAASVLPDSTARALLAEAEALRRNYEFDRSLEICEDVSKRADSVMASAAEASALLARNGLEMLPYCSRPVVVAREKFSVKDFFLYYPLPDGFWRPLPNALDSIPGPLVRATYIPEGAKEIYYSTADADGIRNVQKTELRDSLWSVPELLGEQFSSSGNDIYPMLSPDGKTLFFTSSGLYGMGGYDLYSSAWDEQAREWGTPVNMGFPYSSPADDFLFVNTPDGKYSLFASNRGCGADSVYVYVLEYDSMPVRTDFDDGSDAIRKLAALEPEVNAERLDNSHAVAGSVPENELAKRYAASMTGVQALRDSISALEQRLSAERDRFALADAAGKEALSARILAMENRQMALEDSLGKAVSKLQSLEMEIILSGSVIDPDAVRALADREVKGAGSAYAFSRRSLGRVPQMKVLRPEPTFDYSFMVLSEGRFAEDNNLPSGLVYQIQIFSSVKPAKVSALRGLSPVFSRRNAAGAYVYSVGVFRTYKDVLSKLGAVKKAGFRQAFITAFNDGSSITVAKARKMEK